VATVVVQLRIRQIGSASLIFSLPQLSRSLSYQRSTIASARSNKNEKTTEQLIAELRNRLDWIGCGFLDDSKVKDDEVEAGEVDKRSVRLLDYGCGTGMVSRVCLPISQLLSSLFGKQGWV
jgi:hypothetical protein